MKIESQYVEHQRRHARAQLPPDFARRVIEDARRNAGVAGLAVRLRLVAITGGAMRHGRDIDALDSDAIHPGAKSPELDHHCRANKGA